MSLTELIELIALIAVTLVLIVTFVVALVRGDIKKFIELKMAEAEKLGYDGKKKLEYVVNAVKDKYKIMTIIINVKKVIEHIIEISKQINYKG